MEQIEKEFPLFLQDYRWQMISRKIFTDQKMNISKDDLLKVAKAMTAQQFAMYGLGQVPEQTLTQYAEQMLNNEKEVNRIYEKCEEDKVLDYVKGIVTADVKEVTREELALLNDNAAPAKPAKKKAPAKKAAKAEEEKPAKKKTAKAKAE